MCYDVSYLTKRAERYADHYRIDKDAVQAIMNRQPPVYHTQGFAHPDLPVITNLNPSEIQLFNWGLIPFWVKDVATATKLSNQTLNARGEEMFEKPSYRNSAKKRRCLITVDGFFEHHWEDGKSFPYFIRMKSGEPFSLGGLWESWRLEKEGIERHTVSIVTCRANKLLTHIHNHPKASQGPRMPLVIPRELEQNWLQAPDDPTGYKEIREMVQPLEDGLLEAYTVPRLRGKEYTGNIPQTVEPFHYEGFKGGDRLM